MPKILVEVFCAGCGKYVGDRQVDTPYSGPPRINGCCEVCFPKPQLKVEPIVVPEPVTSGSAQPARVEATDKDVAFLASRGYKVETVEEAQKFIDSFTVDEYVSYMQDIIRAQKAAGEAEANA